MFGQIIFVLKLSCIHRCTVHHTWMVALAVHLFRFDVNSHWKIKAGLWIRINFCGSTCLFQCGSGSGSSLTKFLTICFMIEEFKKTKKLSQKLKIMELVRIYIIFRNKTTISTNFLAFFLFFPWWMRIRIHSPGFN